MELVFTAATGGIEVTDRCGTCHGMLTATATGPGNDSFYRPMTLPDCSAACENGRWALRFAGSSVAAELSLAPQGGLLAGSFSAMGNGLAIVRLAWQLPKGEYTPFVPAFMYGLNDGGKSELATYPRLIADGRESIAKPWAVEEWLVRADRSSHGFASYLGSQYAYALGIADVCRAGGEVCEKNGLGVSHPSVGRISASLGFANAPYTYSAVPGRNQFGRAEGYADLDKGVTAPVFLVVAPANGIHGTASGLLRMAYGLLRQPPAQDNATPQDAVEAVAQALCDYGYSPEARNFRVTMDASGAAAAGNLYNTAWAGGLRAAWPLLAAAHRLGREDWAAVARDVLDNVADNALNPASGLLFENYDLEARAWNTRGWWYRMLEKPGHSAYVNGQACWCLLAAYDATAQAQGNWLGTACAVLDTACRTQAPDGRFGYTYSESDGSIADGDGFSGCWFAPALALAWRITGQTEYLAAARKATVFYAGCLVRFDAFGGPHDICKSPDEEGVLAFIKAAHLLHQFTGERQYLDWLLLGLDYEFSWRFAYDVHNELEPLRSWGWRSTGGSVTSVNNSHVHPMGSAILASIAYAAQQTGDGHYQQRFEDGLAWTLSAWLRRDGWYDWGRKGMINERFCYTDALLNERYPDGSPASTWFCAHSWASGAVLEGLTEMLL